MRYLLFLLFPSLLFADSLRVECSADGFIANVTAARTTGSFTIQGGSGTDAGALLNEAAPSSNSSTATTARIGTFSNSVNKFIWRPELLDDSMRAYASGKIIQWDSARVTLNISAAPGSGDSVTIGIRELKSTRRFVESEVSWDNYAISSPWTTGGAGSTASDIENAAYDTTATLTSTNGSIGTDITFKLEGTQIADTINNAGVVFTAVRYGVNDIPADNTSTLSVSSDDNATAGDRPKITVYYTELDYANFGGSDSLIAKSISSAPTHLPFFTFDISSLSATVDLDSCRWWSYVLNNYSVNTESSILSRILQVMKPTNIGDNNGTVADNGEMDWTGWDERGSGNDSNWTVAGAGDEGSTCNRSDGSGDDLYIGQDFFVNWASTGWNTIKFDTLYVRKYLNGGCNNFGLALAMNASAGDVANYKIEADEKSGSANKTWITIYYTSVATTPTRGTGRFGKSTTGAYLNDR